MQTIIVAGIDWSMTSPAICIHHGNDWSISNCQFFFRCDKKKIVAECVAASGGKLNGTLISPYDCNEQRFYNNADWAHQLFVNVRPIVTCLEGYAMGATGKQFHIGESTGLLKQRLWELSLPFQSVPPTVIKKAATGKGNSKKDVLEAAFFKETGYDVRGALGGGQTASSFNPSSDIIDSYFMAKYAFTELLPDIQKRLQKQ